MLRIPLDPGFDGFRLACLREPAGVDELAAAAGAIALLDRLLVAEGAGCVPPGAAAQLPVPDRDRVLAALHRDRFGDRIEADADCPLCGERFEVRFSLEALVAGHTPGHPADVEGPDALGHFRLGGLRFRLPASADLAAAAVLPADWQRHALLTACTVEGDPRGREDALEAAMAALGPALDADVAARCPHCAATAPLRFEIGAYLRMCFLNERPFVLREAHRLARAYGWSFAEIMALPRAERQDLVRLVESEAEPARRSLSLVR